MNVTVVGDRAERRDTPLVALPVCRWDGEELPEGRLRAVDELFGGAVTRAGRDGDFRGRKGETLLLYPHADGEGPRRLLLVGLGARDDVTREGVRRAAGRVVRRAEKLRLTRLTLQLPPDLPVGPEAAASSAAEGAVLAAWDFREERTTSEGEQDEENGEDGPKDRPLVEELELGMEGDAPAVTEGVRVGVALARGANLARTLQNRPGNVATPTHLAEVAEEMARESGLKGRFLGPAEIREEGMEALLSVARGSDQEPRFIVLEHQGGEEGEAPLVLVGKGLTFDSGGISIKPSGGMQDMKFDMSGGAAVIGAMKAVAELDVQANVVGVVPSTENLLNGSAMKPGDIIGSRAGKRIEVINTDAEGRLILADALSWVADLKPAAVVDCATLTGACVMALGHHASALLGNDDTLVEEVRAAGERTGERCWTLPLWDEYRKQLDSKYADLKNVGGRPAGTITAGWFLREFVGTSKWAHIDIAGTAYGDPKASYLRPGGYGRPARLLAEWVRSRAG